MKKEEIALKMKQFETMINTADKSLADELIASDASFYTPASPEPVFGGDGYLSVVYFMRKGFSDVQWNMEELIAGDDKVAVRWTCSGTNDGDFMGIKATGKKFSACMMNFYYFINAGIIVLDVASEGMLGFVRAIGLMK